MHPLTFNCLTHYRSIDVTDLSYIYGKTPSKHWRLRLETNVDPNIGTWFLQSIVELGRARFRAVRALQAGS